MIPAATTLTLRDLAGKSAIELTRSSQEALSKALASAPDNALQVTLAVTDTGSGKTVGLVLAGKAYGRWEAAGYLGKPQTGQLEAGFTVVYHLGR